MTDELDAGQMLIDRLIKDGFDVRLGFWVKESDAGKWFLYLASPLVDDKGPGAAYRALLALVSAVPELGIDLYSIKLVGMNDSATEKAQEIIRPRVPDSPFAVQYARPYPGRTRFGGRKFAAMNVDEVIIYAPFQGA